MASGFFENSKPEVGGAGDMYTMAHNNNNNNIVYTDDVIIYLYLII